MSFDFREYINNLETEAQSNEIGKMIASGIGVALDKESYLAITALENVYVELETLSKNAAQNDAKLAKKQRERELANLKNSLKLGLITQQEYYERLKKYRDDYLSQGTDEWYKYTDEIVAYNKKVADEAEKEQRKIIDEGLKRYQELTEEKRKQQEKVAKEEIQRQKKIAEEELKRQKELAEKIYSLQKELKENLKATDEEWYSSQKIRLIGVNPNGTDQVYQRNTLSDLSNEVLLLERFRDAVLGLKELGNIPDGVFTEIGNMEISEAVKAAEIILNADKETRKRFISGYNKREELSESIATQLYKILNKEELQEAGLDLDGQMDDETMLFIKTLEENFGSVPEDYYKLGQNSGGAFGEGFKNSISQVVADARVLMLDNMNNLVSELSAIAADVTNGAVSNNNVYNTSFTFNSSRDTTTAQLAAARDAATLEKLRGGTV